MNINMDVQSLCVSENKMRGIPNYMKNIIGFFLEEKKNNYSYSLFDYKKERNNRSLFLKNVGTQINDDCILENNTTDYRRITKAIKDNEKKYFQGTRYDSYFPEGKWDVLFMPCHLRIPFNLKEQTVITVHDILPIFDEKKLIYDPSLSPTFSNSMEYLKSCDIRIISISEYTKEKLIEVYGINEARIDVIYIGYDEEIYYHKVDESVNEKYHIGEEYILYLGAIQRRKDMYSVLKAFEIVKESKKNLKIVFAGDKCADTDDFYDMVHNSKYYKDIILTGYVSDEEKRSLMSGAQAFVFPSLGEGFGLPVLEAMACETPVITTNQTSIPEVGGDAALYVPPRRPDIIAEQILYIMNNSSVRNECIKRGLKQKEKFGWKKCANMTEKIFEKII